jgi:hypothetical protein
MPTLSLFPSKVPVIVAEPAFTAVTDPDDVTVATAVFLDDQVGEMYDSSI